MATPEAASDQWDDAPARLARLFRTYPELGVAWRDPLIEHYRETVLRQRGPDPRFVATVGMSATLILATMMGLFLPRLPTLHLFLIASVLPVWVAFKLFTHFVPVPCQARFAFLGDLKHEFWRMLPFEPERAARLMAIKVVLDRSRSQPLTEAAWAATLFAVVQYGLFRFVGAEAALIPFLAMFLLYRYWRVRELHINESTEAYAVACLFEQLAPALSLPPLSQDSTATSAQKRIMYGDWSQELRGSIPTIFGVTQESLQWVALLGPYVGIAVFGAMMIRFATLAVMMMVLPPGKFADYLRRRLKGGLPNFVFESILSSWADLLRRWQTRGMGDPELKGNAAAKQLTPGPGGLTPKQKREQQERFRKWGS